MKNILYIGPYKENNGLGCSARRYIDALGSSLDINLVTRPIFFTANIDNTNQSQRDYVEFEDKHLDNYDMVIQHGYPTCFEYHKKYGENIAIPEIETYNIGHTGWVERLNMMDRVIVPSQWSYRCLIDSKVKTRIDIIPEPIKTKDYNYDSIIDNNNNSYVFYFVGSYQEKNNILGIISAFMLEFSKADNAKLVIKTSVNGVTKDEAEKIIAYDIEKTQTALRINSNLIHAPYILVGSYDKDILSRLHKDCDCYVDAVRCESFGISAIEAVMAGNTAIVNSQLGANTYINEDNGFVVDNMMTNVYSSNYYIPNSFTIYEQWLEPDINSLRQKMREAFELSDQERKVKCKKLNTDIFSSDYFINKLL